GRTQDRIANFGEAARSEHMAVAEDLAALASCNDGAQRPRGLFDVSNAGTRSHDPGSGMLRRCGIQPQVADLDHVRRQQFISERWMYRWRHRFITLETRQ